MIKDEFHLCQSPARERLGAVSSQFIIQRAQLSWFPDWIGEEGGGAGGLSASLEWSLGPMVVLWAGPGRDEQVGPARGGMERESCGEVCVCVCVCVCACAHTCTCTCTHSHARMSGAVLTV